MVWVVVPVAVRAKSELPDGPVPTVMSCGAETLALKLVDPMKNAVKECDPWVMEGMVKTASPVAERGV